MLSPKMFRFKNWVGMGRKKMISVHHEDTIVDVSFRDFLSISVSAHCVQWLNIKKKVCRTTININKKYKYIHCIEKNRAQ